MFDFRYPRWISPFLGALLGGVCAIPIPFVMPFVVPPRDGDDALSLGGWEYALGAGIGLLAGLVILVADPPKRSSKRTMLLPQEPSRTHEPNFDPWISTTVAPPEPQPGPRLIARVFALIALFHCVMPLIGPCLAVLAFIANRTDRGWVRVVSIVALIVSAIVTLIFVGGIILGALEEQLLIPRSMTSARPPSSPTAARRSPGSP